MNQQPIREVDSKLSRTTEPEHWNVGVHSAWRRLGGDALNGSHLLQALDEVTKKIAKVRAKATAPVAANDAANVPAVA